jgi:pimeloyl-ACP methyl ester carboxylesterase
LLSSLEYAQLRQVAGSGHAMDQQKPEAIAQAIQDVLQEVKQQKL